MTVAGQRPLLIVEDELLIAMQVEDVLGDAGYADVTTAGSLTEALALADRGFAAAVLDVNLAGDPVWPVADRLAAAGVPFILASGGGGSIPPTHAHRPRLAKPYQPAQLLAALAALGCPPPQG